MAEMMQEEMAQQDPAMAQQQAPAPEQQPPQAGSEMPPEQMREAVEGQKQGGGKAQEIHERFVLNVMNLASGQEYDKVMAFMQSADTPAQGFARALFFILEAVKIGMQNKGIEVPGKLWLAKNGIIEQSAKLIAVLGLKAGIELTPEDITEGIEVAAEAIAEVDAVEKQQSEQGGQMPQPQQTPEQAPQPEQMQQPMPQEQPPQGGGMLSRAQGGV